MDSARVELAGLDALTIAELKALLQEKHAQLVVQDAQIRSYTIQIEALKLQILKLRQMQFGKRSEKREQEIRQLELWVAQLEQAVTQQSGELSEQVDSPRTASIPKPRREFPRICRAKRRRSHRARCAFDDRSSSWRSAAQRYRRRLETSKRIQHWLQKQLRETIRRLLNLRMHFNGGSV